MVIRSSKSDILVSLSQLFGINEVLASGSGFVFDENFAFEMLLIDEIIFNAACFGNWLVTALPARANNDWGLAGITALGAGKIFGGINAFFEHAARLTVWQNVATEHDDVIFVFARAMSGGARGQIDRGNEIALKVDDENSNKVLDDLVNMLAGIATGIHDAANDMDEMREHEHGDKDHGADQNTEHVDWTFALLLDEYEVRDDKYGRHDGDERHGEIEEIWKNGHKLVKEIADGIGGRGAFKDIFKNFEE